MKKGHVIKSVDPGSIAEELGVEPPVFRRSTRKIPTFCFLESQKSNFTQPENPLFSTKFQCPIWAFFIEKIYFLWYNNSTS